MNPTIRTILIVVGVALFAAAAGSHFGWWAVNATGCALSAFACWLASTLP